MRECYSLVPRLIDTRYTASVTSKAKFYNSSRILIEQNEKIFKIVQKCGRGGFRALERVWKSLGR